MLETTQFYQSLKKAAFSAKASAFYVQTEKIDENSVNFSREFELRKVSKLLSCGD